LNATARQIFLPGRFACTPLNRRGLSWRNQRLHRDGC
jgi:hypothetical protein